MSWTVTGKGYNPTPNISNLIFSLNAGDILSYPGSGTTWTEQVSNINATLTNGPTFSSANGGSIVFDGTNDYAVTANTTFNLSASHTISAFVSPNFASSSNTGSAIFDFSNSGGTLRSYLRWEGPSLGFYWDFVGNNYSTLTRTSSAPSFSANSWLHVCFSYTYGTTCVIYINGSSVAATLGMGGNSINNLPLGVSSFPIKIGFGSANNYYWNGKIAVVNLYSKALTSDEVSTEFNFYKSRFGL